MVGYILHKFYIDIEGEGSVEEDDTYKDPELEINHEPDLDPQLEGHWKL